MKYKEFRRWCKHRSYDGRWSMITAARCIEIMQRVNEQPFWKRERYWRDDINRNNRVEESIVNPTNTAIAKHRRNQNRRE